MIVTRTANKLLDILEKSGVAIRVYITHRDRMTSKILMQNRGIWRYFKTRTSNNTVYMLDIKGTGVTIFGVEDIDKIVFKLGGNEIHVTQYITVKQGD